MCDPPYMEGMHGIRAGCYVTEKKEESDDELSVKNYEIAALEKDMLILEHRHEIALLRKDQEIAILRNELEEYKQQDLEKFRGYSPALQYMRYRR